MPIGSDWRSPTAYAYVSDLEPADLAWEFLRRNPAYQRDYRKAVRRPASTEELFVRRWGMPFRGRSRAKRR
ncbi:transcriptional regulator domain-containing protein [Rhodovulum sp. PH10]|uniref:transcriptional regulator domain-containing protein n=1 Tax=Rhodovulum sp. PH10 TaxID=1187851 RepID=UPI000A00FD55